MTAIHFDEWCHHMHEVQHALVALDTNRVDPRAARDAFLAVLALAQILDGAYSDDERTATTLELTQLAVDELLDALAPWVTTDGEASELVFGGESLAGALVRMVSSCQRPTADERAQPDGMEDPPGSRLCP